jgi:hypothetical protein
VAGRVTVARPVPGYWLPWKVSNRYSGGRPGGRLTTVRERPGPAVRHVRKARNHVRTLGIRTSTWRRTRA